MPELTGRFILTAWTQPYVEVARVLREAFPERKIRARSMPDWISLWVAALHPRLDTRAMKRLLRRRTQFSNEDAVERLGAEFRDFATALVDTANSLAALENAGDG